MATEMIHEFPAQNEMIRQGAIFQALPRVEISLTALSVLTENSEPEAVTWDAVRDSRDPIAAIIGVRPVWAIVITQDCDTVRAPDISLCEMKPFGEVVRVSVPATAKKWTDLLRTQALQNLKWFYLPPDNTLGLQDRMAVDFMSTLRVTRTDLESSRHLRRGRLNSVADEHFRERLADFFRRYPYNEWYPFNKDEFEAYRASHPQAADIIAPYDYQR